MLDVEWGMLNFEWGWGILNGRGEGGGITVFMDLGKNNKTIIERLILFCGVAIFL